MPERRPFERIAQGGSDLAFGCWAWIPAAAGLLSWPYLGVPLGMLAALCAWWRVLGLIPLAVRRNPGVEVGHWPRAWLLLAVGTSITGCVAMAMAVAGRLGADIAGTAALWDLWRVLTLLEMCVAIGWIAREALERDSPWAATLMVLAGTALAITCILQCAVRWAPETMLQSRLRVILTLLGITGTGILSVMLVMDGAGRLMSVMSGECLDAEQADASGGR